MQYSNDETIHVASTSDGAEPSERRKSRRYPLRSRALLAVQGSFRQVHGRTHDLSPGGVSVFVPTAVPVDSTCALGFSVQVNGELRKVSAIGRVKSCICVAADEFRIGFEFVELNEMSTQTVATLVE